MSSLKLWITLGICLTCTLRIEGKEWKKANLETLKFVQLIMRHGERNPMGFMPKDPNNNDPNYWAGGPQHLTPKGVMQTHELGSFFRARYDGFLSRTYHQDEIDAWSSFTDRSVRSGSSFLRGLYPKRYGNNASHDEEYDDGEVSQVVPLRTVPKNDDNYIYMENDLCPEFKRLHQVQFIESKEYKALASQNKGMIKLISENTGLENTLKGVGRYFDYIIVQTHQNKTIPSWVTPDILPFGEEFLIYWFASETKTQEMKRLKSPIVERTLKNLLRKAQGKEKEKLKFILYSGHDRTIVTFLNILEIFNHLPTAYSTAVLVELHHDPRSASGHFIEIYYRNDSRVEPYKLEMSKCPSPCLLGRFKKNVEPLFLKDYHKACHSFAVMILPSSLLMLFSMALSRA